ncbi:MAG: cysteine-rich repeat protein, partial [Polyangiales bacterium]
MLAHIHHRTTIFGGISHASWAGGANLKAVTRTILIAVTALLALGCGGDAPVSCLTSDDCDVGSVCTDGFCEVIGTCASDAECQDTNACNGDETCDGGRCVLGQATEDGSLCDADDDDDTLDICGSGMCAPTRCGDGFLDMDAGEVCDDGNSLNGDGCDSCSF